MTQREREETIEYLKNSWMSEYQKRIYDMAIQALESQDEDCISRKEAVHALRQAMYDYEDKTEAQFIHSKELDAWDWFEHRIFVQNMNDIDVQTINDLPSVTPKPKTGYWIKPKGKVKPFGDDTVQCDMCGFFTDVDCYYNFCPNCGAKMVEPQERSE